MPTVTKFAITENSKYLILASDGLWDMLSHARVLRSEARAAYGAKHPVVASAIANEGLMHKALGDHALAIDA